MEDKKINSIQALRFIAFLGIFSSHSISTYLGPWGVSVFIILSGFVMMYSYSEKTVDSSLSGCIRFALKKISKLYPLHILMLFVAFPLCINYSQPVLKYIYSVFLIQGWLVTAENVFAINAVAWYLSLCLFFYFIFPVILKILKKIDSNIELILISFIIFFVQCFVAILLPHINRPFMWELGVEKWVTYFCPLFRLGDFIIGCCFGCIFKRSKNTVNSFIATVSEIITFIAVYLSVHYSKKGEGLVGVLKYNMLFTVTSILLVYLFALNSGIFTRLITNKVTVYLGNISGYAFLIHAILITYLTQFLYVSFPMTNNFFKFSFELVLTIIASFLYSILHKFVLKKYNNAKKEDK